ncbi:hypothetical protein C8A05DRAFT_45693 [Staphylotrichum tortipilum]|uniref:Rab-GAP TBC domain-containing protein n=1 Tax=Staphylotrichum tortipilum TaxID=2831512 RepID=A0AAN6MGI5_9PEZI|nr:hypothetical protein C8A05DRAFT_45693 [Staphylotrichum longicolle]
MVLPRFGSMRHHLGRPAGGGASRLTPFRDDTALVALRYEQTKQAEPPIPLPPPRDPRRMSRAPSTSTASSTTATATSPTARSVPTSPVVVVPPPVAPPREEHPFFRTTSISTKSSSTTNATTRRRSRRRSQGAGDEWKRDSGAPTSSTVTLREECAEEDPLNLGHHHHHHHKLLLLDDIADVASVYSRPRDKIAHRPQTAVAQPPSQSQPLSPSLSPSKSKSKSKSPRLLTVAIPPPPAAADSASSPTGVSSPTRRTSLARKLSRSFGIGPDGSKRLRKKMLGGDRAAPATGAPELAELAELPPSGARQGTPGAGEAAAEPLRGSVKYAGATSSTPKSPKPPKSPKSPKSHKLRRDQEQAQEQADASASPLFAPITTHIPDDNLWDDLGAVAFSKRGSIMFGGKNEGGLFKSLLAMSASTPTSTPASLSTANAPDGVNIAIDNMDKNMQQETKAAPSPAEVTMPTSADTCNATTDKAAVAPPIRVSSMDVERESQKVRSLYESGDGLNWEDGARVSYAERLEPTAEVPSDEDEHAVYASALQPSDPSNPAPPAATNNTPRSANSLSPLRDSQVRRDYERAGGIEDWADLDGVAVDRYGFISPKRPVSSAGTAEMKSSRFSSRRRNLLTKRPSTSHASTPYSTSLPGGFIRPPSRKVSARSLNTFTSELSTISRRSTRSSIRSATNRLPHNRDRRWMDEASEMLSLQAGMTGITDDEKLGKTLEAQKRKEAERTEKWRKMATAIKSTSTTANNNTITETTTKEPQGSQSPSPQGQGVSYSFDTTSPKLIERTWKGIPDCWRSAAWYSFLATSAERHGGGVSSWARETEDYLTGEFRRLQAVASPDDVQIDLDVPRTINGHIMFRRRYRGGQRLLFRVLHAISLYFPDTGYVQGMASLAATLLCYFDEERAFVMLVRMWRYRGLEGLYKPGFAGLMAALDELEAGWLGGAGKEVKAKLNELAIDATAYGTRWYLTLFNLSIPFPAQLRVWDVFMLLGDCPPEPELPSRPSSPSPSTKPTTTTPAGDNNTTNPLRQQPTQPQEDKSPKGLSILHATSAALIHALRDVLLDADFENAMRSLTAWIPVRDEDLLMKVARAEWRRHQQLQQAGSRRLWDLHGLNGGKDNNGGGGKEGKNKEEKERKSREEKDRERKEEKDRERKEEKERREREKKEKEREKARDRELREREREIRELEKAREKEARKEKEKGKGKEKEKEKGKEKEKSKGMLAGLVGRASEE